MQYRNDRPSGLRERQEGIVEVKVWEAFLLYNRHNLYSTLATYDIDNGMESNKDVDQGSVAFRFTNYDWDNTLKKMLNKHNIPVISVVKKTEQYAEARR